jgi:RNase adaptor protein for sRNA GlmZ degradation
MQKDNLHISIYSFGYHKSGIPQDPNGHGGGFVFDCRFLKNPGRELYFQDKTGLDDEVIDYLQKVPGIEPFLNSTCDIIIAAAKHYQQQHYKHLMVSFGCTGGQHRSVYCAEYIATCLRRKGFSISLTHVDLDKSLIHG